jgi:hypothetical protein
MPAAVASVERAMRILHMYLDGRQSLAVTDSDLYQRRSTV